MSDGSTNWGSAIMLILNGTKEEHLNMLEGGIIAKLLDEKWSTYAQVITNQNPALSTNHNTGHVHEEAWDPDPTPADSIHGRVSGIDQSEHTSHGIDQSHRSGPQRSTVYCAASSPAPATSRPRM